MSMVNKLMAEFFGTFWLVFGGCGSAVLAAQFIVENQNTHLGIGFVGVSLAFGLTVLTMVYAIGHISGCHLNPAVSAGLCTGGRFKSEEVVPYILAQVVGALAGSLVLYIIASGRPGFAITDKAGSFATNGFGTLSPGGYSLLSCSVAEFVLTFFFLIVILGATDGRAPSGFAGIAIGLALTLIHLIGIPVTNLSVNPARSTGPAVIAGVFGNNWGPLGQLWLFWLAPLLGGSAAGVVYNIMAPKEEKVGGTGS